MFSDCFQADLLRDCCDGSVRRSVAAEIKLPGRLVAPDFSRLITDGTWAVQSVLNNYCDFEVQDIYLKTRYQEKNNIKK